MWTQRLTLSFVIASAILISLAILFFTPEAKAQYGSCSEYGVMAFESGGYCKCMSGYVMGENMFGDSQCISESQACTDKYGYNARASYTGGCECRSGYVFEDSYLGTQCVSGDNVCSDKHGFGAEYDSYSGSCECRSGYVWGENMFGESQCVSEDQACKDTYGYNARSTYGGQCECSYGYVIEGGKCVDGDQVCRSDHGIYASYDNLSNSCECDSGYTFDDYNQCVEKQNNVYFKLLDINPEDDQELLIKSEYDYSTYIVRVGFGCYSSSIARYLGKNLVLNLGTDFDVDTFDTVVLQDDDETCSIMSREKTYTDSFPEPEEEYDNYYYTPQVQTYTQNSYVPLASTPEISEPNILNDDRNIFSEISGTESDDLKTEIPSLAPEATTSLSGIVAPEVKQNFFTKLLNFFRGLF